MHRRSRRLNDMAKKLRVPVMELFDFREEERPTPNERSSHFTHDSLFVSAMEAGISWHVWSIQEIAALFFQTP